MRFRSSSFARSALTFSDSSSWVRSAFCCCSRITSALDVLSASVLASCRDFCSEATYSCASCRTVSVIAPSDLKAFST